MRYKKKIGKKKRKTRGEEGKRREREREREKSHQNPSFYSSFLGEGRGIFARRILF